MHLSLLPGKMAVYCIILIINESCVVMAILLLMDFGAEYANYTADMSRTIPVNGKFSERQKACYKAVLRVFKELRKLYVPEIPLILLIHLPNN